MLDIMKLDYGFKLFESINNREFYSFSSIVIYKKKFNYSVYKLKVSYDYEWSPSYVKLNM